jgi:hypothetical protein
VPFWGNTICTLSEIYSKLSVSGSTTARKQIPNLFERLIILAYQKDAPLFSEWIRKGDERSLKEFREEFSSFSRDYSAQPQLTSRPKMVQRANAG